MYANLEYQYLNNSTIPKDDYMDKAEAFSALFASVFNTDDGPRESQWPEQEDHACEKD